MARLIQCASRNNGVSFVASALVLASYLVGVVSKNTASFPVLPGAILSAITIGFVFVSFSIAAFRVAHRERVRAGTLRRSASAV